ncbi:hypothetical protein H7J93_23730 [Mycobacterium barrassiae]|uniref:hypothetical protein n=1 Tax=Mycobacterium barrassiae TaxID=319709 RepID=UPI002265DDBA|nr:hypothetical protein [Mycobacterium barrassiae]MCV7302639.1 hypothetical protein [Mycobacterium barrassiae]
MLGRDKITINFSEGRTGPRFSRTVYGTIVTEHLDGKLQPFSNVLVFLNYYRLILPRTLDLSGGNIVTVDFGTKVGARFETPPVRVYDARGRVRHWEGVVRSS